MRSALHVAFTIACLLLPCSVHAAEQRPNFVVIMADDLGYADLGCYGSEIETPNLDQLAYDGLRFTQFYNTAKCHSSRVCLLSGQWCHQADGPRKSGEGMSRAVTFADVLHDAGYFTAMTGKWHLKQNPVDRGFDRYFGHLSGATNFFTGDDTFRLDREPWDDFDEDFYTTDANTDWAIKFIEQGLSENKPFLTYIAYNAPHYPLHVREEEYRKYEHRYEAGWDIIHKERFDKQKQLGIVHKDANLPARPKAIPAWKSLNSEQKDWEARRMAAFAGMIDRVDQQIGRLVDFLKKKDAFENTVILFVADNGGCPFERTRGKQYEPWDARSYWTYDTSWAWVSNTPLKYYKQNEHEGGISSPAIVHWPAGLKAKGFCDQPAHLVDVLPTLMELGHGSYPEQQGGREIRALDGKSLVPLLNGNSWESDRELFFQFSSNRALRQGDWKLVNCTGGAWELYHIAEDRFEQNNVAEQHPDLVKKMVQRYEELWGVPVKVKDSPGIPTTHNPRQKKNNK